MWWLALAFACTGGNDPIVTDNQGSTVRLRLLNPTDVDLPDYDSVELEILVEDTVVASERFDLDEAWELEELSSFGALRFRVAGYDEDRVVVYGRSPVMVLSPGIDRDVPILFLPPNEAHFLSLDAALANPRFRHGQIAMPGGRVLVFGGAQTQGGSMDLRSVEVFDPGESTFSTLEEELLYPLLEPTWAEKEDGEFVITGGQSLGSATSFVSSLDPGKDKFYSLASMISPRSGHCFTFFRDNYGVAIGGNNALSDTLETIRPSDSTGEFGWTEVSMQQLVTQEVNDCVTVPDGRVFLQGVSSSSTGVFSYSEEDQANGLFVTNAFTPISGGSFASAIYSRGAMLIPRDPVTAGGSPRVWVYGGVDAQTGAVTNEAREYLLDSGTFVNAVGTGMSSRVGGSWDRWIESEHYALGCGYNDPSVVPTIPQTAIELIDLNSGRYWDWTMPRSRAGCRLSVLDDGTLLIVGGQPEVGETAPSSVAVLVPYLED